VNSENAAAAGYLGSLSRLFRWLVSFAFVMLFALLLLIAWNAAASSPVLLRWIGFSSWALGVLSFVSLVVGVVYVYLKYAELRLAIVFISILTTATFVAHMYTIYEPKEHSIMDETYYVPSSITLVNGTHCRPYGEGCNMEHPFLAKAIIGAGMVAFGQVGFGWRIPQVILGTFCIPLFFILSWRVTKNKRLSYFSVLLLSFDTMFFVHSGAALIDIQQVFFALTAFVIYFCEVRVWKLNKYFLAGIALGLTGLSKETGVFLAGALVTYHLAFSSERKLTRVFTSVEMLALALIVFIVGLQAYDSLLTFGAVPTFVDHVKFMLSYGGSLIGPGWTDRVLNTPITPINWLTFYSPIEYFATTVTVCTNLVNGSCLSSYSYIGIGYYGITNMLETWMTFFWAPLVGVEMYRWRRAKVAALEPTTSPESTPIRENGDFKLAAFAFIWFAWAYLPYLAIFGYGRVTYPFYMVPAIPAIALGCGYFITRSWFPPRLTWVYLIAVAVWFFLYFPDKGFLPGTVRAIIGR
jgi:4-amino-4-deoxy-L-arabinose transferase-like glycosyltransferase